MQVLLENAEKNEKLLAIFFVLAIVAFGWEKAISYHPSHHHLIWLSIPTMKGEKYDNT
ncbi:MAG: hypothetical protein HZB37_07735 [Planctomycetes bacterium]|nr:hypothetical protein [Planctomycetota bacterium]